MSDLQILYLNYLLDNVMKEYHIIGQLYDDYQDAENLNSYSDLLKKQLEEDETLQEFEFQKECDDFTLNLVEDFRINMKDEERLNYHIIRFDQEHQLISYYHKVRIYTEVKKEEMHKMACHLPSLQDFQLEDSRFLLISMDSTKQTCTLVLNDVLSTIRHDSFVDNGKLTIQYKGVQYVTFSGCVDMEECQVNGVLASYLKKTEGGMYQADILATYGTKYFILQIRFTEADTSYEARKNPWREQGMRIRI
ncbi:MAG: hypothetical protein E7256_03805 [Lachnospiraceae bacterium]|nr:hypothetical protein [Lachnospiraceae bacterium]